MRLRPILLVLLLVEVSLAAAGEIKIGVIVPLTGDMATHGVEMQRAMTLALGDAGRAKLHHRYTLLFEDNELSPAKSIAAAQKLINMESVDVIVTLWPPTASVVAPVADRAGILHYTIAWDPELAKNHKLLLNHQVMVDEIARSSLRLMRAQGKTRVAFLYLQESGFALGARKIQALADSECVELEAVSFHPGETDFRSIVSRAMQTKPQAFLIWSVMPSLDLLIRQIRLQDPRAVISGYLDYAQELTAIEGAKYVSEMFASDLFARRYHEAYGEAPKSKGPNAFDMTNLLVRAYESSPGVKLEAAAVKSFITAQRDVAGAVGRFSVQADGNSFYAPVVRKIVGGERVLVPDALPCDACSR